MRVLHILYSGHTGGIARFTEQLFIAQKETLDPALAFGRAEGPLWERAQAQAWLAYDLRIKRGWPTNPLRLKMAERIFGGFDVLHFHYFHPELARIALKTKSRIVFTEHGMFDQERTRLKRILKVRSKKRFLSDNRVVVVANSRFTAGKIEEIYGAEAMVIPVGEFISEIKPKRPREEVRECLGLSHGDFVVAYLGRLARMKRLDRMIQSLENTGTRLLVIGDGSQRLPLPSWAIHLGLVENPFDYLAAADLMIMPGQGEPFGLSALEAMALGVPVLCFSDGGGVCELLEGYPELIVSDVTEMRERVLYYMREPDEARYIGESLRRRAVDYDITRVARAYEMIYHELG
ncbi:MAG: glycosyltransferase family 4 protein [candidate division WOR-3 bacterium]